MVYKQQTIFFQIDLQENIKKSFSRQTLPFLTKGSNYISLSVQFNNFTPKAFMQYQEMFMMYKRIYNDDHNKKLIYFLNFLLGIRNLNQNYKIISKIAKFSYSIMINNNPYNNMDHRPQKLNRIYTETSNAGYRNQSVENIPVYNNHANIPTYTNRNNMNNNLIMKRSGTFNMEEMQGYRPPLYQPLRTQMQQYMSTPKNQNIGNTQQQQLHFNGNGIGGSGSLITQRKDRRQSSEVRQNSAIFYDSKQLSQKLQILTKAVKQNEKRITQLERHQGGSSLSNISKLSQHDQIQEYKMQSTNHVRNEKEQSIKKLRDEILQAREQVRNYLQSNDADRIINQKVKLMIDQNKGSESLQISSIHQYNNIEQLSQLKREVQQIRSQLDEKISKNYDYLTSTVTKIQRQIHALNLNMNTNIQYKSSGIKCSGTAILLRFIQCFKVRKNSHSHLQIGGKGGQSKITLMDNTYYIDSQGYLLDKEQCYLLDNRGNQVKLDQKHIKILKDQNILI